FTELGAGFRIAALDLEIRGAGEFLGARQSGHIAAVGFELYAQLLEKAVRRLSGAEVAPEREAATVNLEVPASLPEEYVGEAGQRLAVYKRLSAAETAAEIAALRDETVDRFGPLPAPAATLFRLAELRVAAEAQGAIAVDWVGDGVTVRYGARPKIDAERLVDLARSDAGVRLSPAGIVKLRVADPRADRIAAAALALRKLAGPEA
ncbi:MAG: TRCF domain-containing protein, partial [Candidatus Polarisedimenticolia bacterium]